MSTPIHAAGPVVLASDHGGFDLKEALKRHLSKQGVAIIDAGTHNKDACDYPVFATAAALTVARGQAWRGVVVDGAGIGSGMVANKVPGVRSAMAFDVATARNAREHNDANLLTLGAGYLSEETAIKVLDAFLTTDCTLDRHKRRVAMIDALDHGRSLPPFSDTTRTSELMPSTDRASLVQAIVDVLSANPTLLSGATDMPGGAPSFCENGVCVACGNCISKRADSVRAIVGNGPMRLASAPGLGAVPEDIAKFIDHTLLKPEATYADIDKLCAEAAKFGFASVCVNPVHVRRCADKLKGSSALVCTVVGFPLGATPSDIKALEARRALRDGAREIDMVIAIGALKSGDHKYVYDDIRTVAETVHEGRAILKVILETALLTDEEKIAGCVAAKKARADFVKTSTGFAKGGATVHDVTLMATAVDHRLGVKASGGVGSVDDARKMIQAGATRIGASVGVKIVQESRGEKSDQASAKAAY
ncbi:MAG: deoxyribose-phosphate aldolase [Myxococcales bacterium]|nr:deoxyribose-phosphate aldolase [Myxococcales bacterium]